MTSTGVAKDSLEQVVLAQIRKYVTRAGYYRHVPPATIVKDLGISRRDVIQALYSLERFGLVSYQRANGSFVAVNENTIEADGLYNSQRLVQLSAQYNLILRAKAGICRYCRFYDSIKSQCHYMAPTHNDGWPVVQPEDWCGQFRVKVSD